MLEGGAHRSYRRVTMKNKGAVMIGVTTNIEAEFGINQTAILVEHFPDVLLTITVPILPIKLISSWKKLLASLSPNTVRVALFSKHLSRHLYI